jgi:hypothetical protein
MADTVIAELMRRSVAEEMYVHPAMRKHLPDGAPRSSTTSSGATDSTVPTARTVDRGLNRA